jgi:hypothetical protein
LECVEYAESDAGLRVRYVTSGDAENPTDVLTWIDLAESADVVVVTAVAQGAPGDQVLNRTLMCVEVGLARRSATALSATAGGESSLRSDGRTARSRTAWTGLPHDRSNVTDHRRGPTAPVTRGCTLRRTAFLEERERTASRLTRSARVDDTSIGAEANSRDNRVVEPESV